MKASMKNRIAALENVLNLCNEFNLQETRKDVINRINELKNV